MSRFFTAHWTTALLLGALAANTHAQDAAADFAQKLPLNLVGNGPWYQLNIGMPVQLGATHADLRDLRVFDAQGKAQPYALLRTPAQQNTNTEHAADVRLFPLHRPVQAGAPQADTRIQQNGAVVEVHTPGSGSSDAPQLHGWLLDASKTDFPLERLQLDWSNGEEGFQSFSIEASDDLQHWQHWGRGQLARLAFDGQQLDVSEVKLPAGRAKYLRLLWPANAPAAALKSARLLGNTRSSEASPLIWSEPLPGRQAKSGEFQWQLPQALPLQKIRFALAPEMKHIVVPVELSGRNAATARSQREAQNWRPLARGVLYRLPQDGRDVQVDELDIPYPQSVQELRLRVDSRGSGLGNQAPSIRVGMNGSQIVFLAEGHAPYQLAFGNAKAQAAQLPLTVLIPGYVEGQQTFGQATLAAEPTNGASASSARPATGPQSTTNWKKIGLWLVLLLGVGAIVGMAMSLLRKKA